jgi:hypothetical protein
MRLLDALQAACPALLHEDSGMTEPLRCCGAAKQSSARLSALALFAVLVPDSACVGARAGDVGAASATRTVHHKVRALLSTGAGTSASCLLAAKWCLFISPPLPQPFARAAALVHALRRGHLILLSARGAVRHL